MRKLTILIMVMFSLFLGFSSYYSFAEEPSDTVTAYFEALRDGNVEAIKQHIGGEFYEKYRVLLEDNPEYPEFLRNFYGGAEVEIGKTVKSGEDIIVEMKTRFADGSVGVNKLRLRKDANGEWKIVEEIFD